MQITYEQTVFERLVTLDKQSTISHVDVNEEEWVEIIQYLGSNKIWYEHEDNWIKVPNYDFTIYLQE